jgi:hypothetical protein
MRAVETYSNGRHIFIAHFHVVVVGLEAAVNLLVRVSLAGHGQWLRAHLSDFGRRRRGSSRLLVDRQKTRSGWTSCGVAHFLETLLLRTPSKAAKKICVKVYRDC